MNKRSRKHLVIIGNSGAAINAVKGIRELDAVSAITIISKERHRAYAPVLTTYLISGKADKKKMMLVDKDFYEHNGVRCINNKKVSCIDTKEQQVILEDGGSLAYDQVLIATGASAKCLDVDYPLGAPIFTLRTMEDAENIRNKVPNKGRVAFYGAGLVSLQVASALAEKLDRMIFVVGSNQILSQNLEPRSAAIVQNRFESKGAEFLFGRRIVRIEHGLAETPVLLHLDDGMTMEVDALVVGKGVRPNIPEVVPKDAITIGSGIRVDERMETSTKGVYAAGDVCETREIVSGDYRLIATWPNACAQGRVAGRNMAGGEIAYIGSMSMNVTSLLGLPFASIGRVREGANGRQESAFFLDESRDIFKKFTFEGDQLVGAILLGDLKEVASIVPVIRNKISLSREKKLLMADPARMARILNGLS